MYSDLCSFYKEELARESANLVPDRAKAAGVLDVATSLQDITSELVDAVKKTRLILNGGMEKDTWEKFMTGYIAYHKISPRYRLHDLLGNSDRY